MDLVNKVCLITGGTRGIGAASAIDLARRGADLVLVGRVMDDEAISVKKTIEAEGRRCHLVIADLGKREDAARCVEEAVAHFGRLDVLIHSAGGAVPGSVMDTSEDAWYAAFDVHVHAIFH